MPGLSYLLDEANDDSGLDAHLEMLKLRLPSQLSPHDHDSWCLPGLPSLEARFWSAQADDVLAEICQLQRLYQGLSDQSRKHITNTQHTVTCMKGTFERYKACISRFATLYRQARRLVVTLDPNGEVTQWASRLLELEETDLRGPGREADKPSKGHVMPSWIWQVPKPSPPLNVSHPNASIDNSDQPDLSHRAASGEEVTVSIRAHWARCQARAEHHEEEVELILEEMRWTLEFFKWKSHWWLTIQNERGTSAAPPDPQIQHGLWAYANRQASMYSSLVNMYMNHWRKFLTQHSLGLEWLSL